MKIKYPFSVILTVAVFCTAIGCVILFNNWSGDDVPSRHDAFGFFLLFVFTISGFAATFEVAYKMLDFVLWKKKEDRPNSIKDQISSLYEAVGSCKDEDTQNRLLDKINELEKQL